MNKNIVATNDIKKFKVRTLKQRYIIIEKYNIKVKTSLTEILAHMILDRIDRDKNKTFDRHLEQ